MGAQERQKKVAGMLINSVGERNYQQLRNRYRFFRRYVHLRRSDRRLERFYNRYAGNRCFIIGNGPSLRRMDLSVLKNAYTFGLNRIYLLFDQMGFSTTFLVAVNELVVRQCAVEIAEQPGIKFINADCCGKIEFTPDMIFLRCLGQPKTAPWFSDNPLSGVCTGGTVTYVAMQLAFYMGFSEAVLIGVDHSFATKGTPHEVVVTEENDPNHFDPNYFGKGFRWQLPDLNRSELSYRIAQFHYERNQRRIFDATVGGRLDVFPKRNFRQLFAPDG